MLNHEKLLCLATQDELLDDGLVLENPASAKPALLRTIYGNNRLQVKEHLPGIFRYADWLPVNRILKSDGFPVTYESRGLRKALGMPNLYITFNGYWPEIGAAMTTGTFKECEAYAVCARCPENSGRILVVASAGNTARAFMKVSSDNDIPVAIVVPERYLDSLWSLEELKPCVRIIAAGGDSDYYDAIRLAGALCRIEGFTNEGGAKNVARRDGMGTTVLSAVTTIGKIPDYYFQAVGSGTGAIAAYEANLRLIRTGGYGNKKMRLIVSQNLPFAPMARAWEKGTRDMEPMDENEAIRLIGRIDARVLSNRQPPYGIIGGLYDALRDTGGDIVTVENREVREAQALFMETEGRDICPEAGVALASLVKKVKEGSIEREACTMLNVTGGGIEALRREHSLRKTPPHLVVDKDSFTADTIRQKVMSLYKGNRTHLFASSRAPRA